ncbi:hypothetical protein D0Q02_26205 [Micromonospora craniellae]|uniref:Uncharacterized protein n=1 Tax=Micromonospora craniellae TaxID=2294034 RepID=A0A372FSP4_9ACTN|nr:hypothetical protein D0Q02_26205 [Micromonospora craniellae]
MSRRNPKQPGPELGVLPVGLVRGDYLAGRPAVMPRSSIRNLRAGSWRTRPPPRCRLRYGGRDRRTNCGQIQLAVDRVRPTGLARGPNIDHRTYKATTSIDVITIEP